MRAYVTRDRCGDVVVRQFKPHKGKSYWYSSPECGFFFLINSNLIKDIDPKWSDDEPIEVELKIEKIFL